MLQSNFGGLLKLPLCLCVRGEAIHTGWSVWIVQQNAQNLTAVAVNLTVTVLTPQIFFMS